MSPTSVRYCIGVRMMSSCTWAAAAASRTRLMSRSGSKKAMLSAIVPDSSRSSCATTPTCARHARQRSGVARMTVELDRAVASAALRPSSSFKSVVLPPPEGPVMATYSPGCNLEIDVLEHQPVGRAVAERHVLDA